MAIGMALFAKQRIVVSASDYPLPSGRCVRLLLERSNNIGDGLHLADGRAVVLDIVNGSGSGARKMIVRGVESGKQRFAAEVGCLCGGSGALADVRGISGRDKL